MSTQSTQSYETVHRAPQSEKFQTGSEKIMKSTQMWAVEVNQIISIKSISGYLFFIPVREVLQHRVNKTIATSSQKKRKKQKRKRRFCPTAQLTHVLEKIKNRRK